MPFESELGIPAPDATSVSIRCSPYPHHETFEPNNWSRYLLHKKEDGWWIFNIPGSGIGDGTYEYEFMVTFPVGHVFNDSHTHEAAIPVPDPFGEEIVKFKGYRSLLHIKGGRRVRPPFSWNNELPANISLPANNQIVIYELPMRWVDAPEDAADRQVDLGTFDKAIFERLSYIHDLGINAIELLPVQDSPDTLNWGYGTRFFFAPDFDMGTPFELKFFIKSCHQLGIRVILDIVMNHSRKCPLRDLAYNWYFGNEKGRNGWGGDLFTYDYEASKGYYPSRNWQHTMAAFWIREYHIDGFRIDEFKGIDNWDFLNEFRIKAWQVFQEAFPGRPFIVIAEDSARRVQVPQSFAYKNGPVADAVWDFDFRDEVRRLLTDTIATELGYPSRSERVKGVIRGDGLIDGKNWRQMRRYLSDKDEKAGYSDLAQRIIYTISHDVEGENEQRLYPYFLKKFQEEWGVDWSYAAIADSHPVIMEQIFAAFALMLTAVGIPMFLAGEEFADIHDLQHNNWRQKMSDPVNWNRMRTDSNKALLVRVRSLIQLRVSEPCLQRNEIEFFGFDGGGFHPDFDKTGQSRVFAYCRTGGKPLGQEGQVAIVCNAGPQDFPVFNFKWPWNNNNIFEVGSNGAQVQIQPKDGRAGIGLKPFQSRVFRIP